MKIIIYLIGIMFLSLFIYDYSYNAGYDTGYGEMADYLPIVRQVAIDEAKEKYTPEYIKLLEPIQNNKYQEGEYNCINFTSEAVISLREKGYEAEPYCYYKNKTSAHAIVKISLFVEPQTNTIVDVTDYKEMKCDYAFGDIK